MGNDERNREDKKSVLSDKEKIAPDKLSHMGDKPGNKDELSKTGQGQGQSKGKPQVQSQE